jgi:hypothetical protein
VIPKGARKTRWKAPQTWKNQDEKNTEEAYQKLSYDQKFFINETERFKKEQHKATKLPRSTAAGQVRKLHTTQVVSH